MIMPFLVIFLWYCWTAIFSPFLFHFYHGINSNQVSWGSLTLILHIFFLNIVEFFIRFNDLFLPQSQARWHSIFDRVLNAMKVECSNWLFSHDSLHRLAYSSPVVSWGINFETACIIVSAIILKLIIISISFVISYVTFLTDSNQRADCGCWCIGCWHFMSWFTC